MRQSISIADHPHSKIFCILLPSRLSAGPWLSNTSDGIICWQTWVFTSKLIWRSSFVMLHNNMRTRVIYIVCPFANTFLQTAHQLTLPNSRDVLFKRIFNAMNYVFVHSQNVCYHRYIMRALSKVWYVFICFMILFSPVCGNHLPSFNFSVPRESCSSGHIGK